MKFFVYKSHFGSSIFDSESNLWIPEDPANTDYQRYLEWVAEGNTPLPWPPEA